MRIAMFGLIFSIACSSEKPAIKPVEQKNKSAKEEKELQEISFSSFSIYQVIYDEVLFDTNKRKFGNLKYAVDTEWEWAQHNKLALISQRKGYMTTIVLEESISKTSFLNVIEHQKDIDSRLAPAFDEDTDISGGLYHVHPTGLGVGIFTIALVDKSQKRKVNEVFKNWNGLESKETYVPIHPMFQTNMSYNSKEASNGYQLGIVCWGEQDSQNWPNRDWGGKSVTSKKQLEFTIQSGTDGQEDKILDGQFSSRKDLKSNAP
jgi:hypothetical protein